MIKPEKSAKIEILEKIVWLAEKEADFLRRLYICLSAGAKKAQS